MREQELFDFLSAAADAAFTVTADGGVRSWNAAAESLFGYPAAEALHRKCYELLRGRGCLGTDVCRADCDVWACAARGHLVPNFDVEVQQRSGERLWVNMSNILYRDPRRGTALMVHLARDISARKGRERLLEQVVEISRQLDGPKSGADALDPVAPLSAHQRQILRLFAQGKESPEVARSLQISVQTLRNHLHHINQKLRTHNRTAAVMQAMQRHLL